jgi:hypothetical protein
MLAALVNYIVRGFSRPEASGRGPAVLAADAAEAPDALERLP